ncbi:MAG: hypothetical protein HWN66_22085 [Candidatus Helarchaeota archaeon]|nr:hypothetical protein [Candidatus Helarchaeota archaeon]
MLKFQKITPGEYKLVKDQLVNSFKLQKFETIIAPFEIILAVGKWKEVLLVTDQLSRVFQEFKDYRNPYAMGIHFGDITRNKFRISLEGITLIAKHVEEKTILTDSGEKKVLYRRDLTKEDLQYIPPSIQKNDLSILTNENGEVLALGKYLINLDEIKTSSRNRKIVKNIIDKGWYLRKGK